MAARYKEYWSIFARYFILILVAIPGLSIFYYFLKPLTIYPSFFLLNIFYEASLSDNTIFVGNLLSGGVIPIEIIEACVAGSAYYLLLILNLSVPNISLPKRIWAIAFSFGSFLAINILRIFILSFMAISGSSLFDVTHIVFWYVLSTIFVVGVWLLEIRLFKIKEIPFYSDIRYLYHKSHFKNKK